MARKWLTIVLSIIIILLLIELISYLVLKNSDSLDFNIPFFNHQIAGSYIFKNSPGFKYNTIKQSNKEEDVKIDKFGFVSLKEPIFVKSKNVVRIFITGGSAAFGNGQSKPYDKIKVYPSGVYSYESSIAGNLYKILKDKYPDYMFEIINACASGRKLNQSVSMYLHIIKDFSPDIVISIDGNNDLETMSGINPFSNDEAILQKKYIQLHNLSEEISSKSFFYTIKLIKYLKLYRYKKNSEKLNKEKLNHLLDYDINAYTEQKYSHVKNRLYEQSEVFLKLILYYNALCEVNKTKFVFCLQPMLYRETNKELTKTESEMKKNVNPINISLSNPDLTREKLKQIEDYGNIEEKFFFDDYLSRRIKTLAMENNFIFIDFNEYLQKKRYNNTEFYTDYCHLTFDANRIVANILYEQIDSIVADRINVCRVQDTVN